MTPPQALPDPTTGQRLLAAAIDEFARAGYAGTDTNRIARAAGFAPQTFYRWYRDKLEIFLAAYRAWEDEERAALAALVGESASPARLIGQVVEHHRSHRLFRRSLRQLAVEQPEVRQARAESRLRQVDAIRSWTGVPARRTGEIAALLLQLERLADAVAEEEFADLGLDDKAARVEMAAILGRLGPGS